MLFFRKGFPLYKIGHSAECVVANSTKLTCGMQDADCKHKEP